MGTQPSILDLNIQPNQFTPILDLADVYQNTKSGKKFRKHYITITTNEQLKYEKDVYIFRRIHQDRLVYGCYFEQIDPPKFCGSSFRISYYTELAEKHLYSYKNVSQSQGLKMLINCLQAYQILYEKFGGFEVKQDQLYVYKINQIRVWLDCDGSRSKPIRSCEAQKVVEQYMIGQIFKLFDHLPNKNRNVCMYTRFLRNFEIQQRNMISFNQIIRYLRQISNKIQIKVENYSFAPLQNNFKIIDSDNKKIKIRQRNKMFRKSQQETQNCPLYQSQHLTKQNSSQKNQYKKINNKMMQTNRIKTTKSSVSRPISQKTENKTSIKNFQKSINNSILNSYQTPKIPLKNRANYYTKESIPQFRESDQSQKQTPKYVHHKKGMYHSQKNYNDQFLHQLKTVKSILHLTDLNIDSEVIYDLKDSENEYIHFRF